MNIDPAKLKIVLYPDPVLRQVAKPLAVVDDHVRAVIERMRQLMHEAEGVGLAAPQVGLPWRLFIASPTADPAGDKAFINPVMTAPSRKQVDMEEGCLSLPDIRGQVFRPKGVTIDALDEHGQPFQATSDDFPARVWQHEFDHLEGILILDKMDALDKIANRKLIKELESDFKA